MHRWTIVAGLALAAPSRSTGAWWRSRSELPSRRTSPQIATAAIAPDGRALVAWPEKDGRIVARIRDPGRRRFGASETVATAVSRLEGLQAAFTPTAGRPALVWPTDDGVHRAVRDRP